MSTPKVPAAFPRADQAGLTKREFMATQILVALCRTHLTEDDPRMLAQTQRGVPNPGVKRKEALQRLNELVDASVYAADRLLFELADDQADDEPPFDPDPSDDPESGVDLADPRHQQEDRS